MRRFRFRQHLWLLPVVAILIADFAMALFIDTRPNAIEHLPVGQSLGAAPAVEVAEPSVPAAITRSNATTLPEEQPATF
jgi:hypothetical protein